MANEDGRRMLFVATPSLAPAREGYAYARPDDTSDDGTSWRARLAEYNKHCRANPLDLCPAYKLYANAVYGALIGKYGAENVYILSAGWGLIGADFLTPKYNETIGF